MHEVVEAILAECGIMARQLKNGFGLTSRTVHYSDHTGVTGVIANGYRHQEARCWTIHDVMLDEQVSKDLPKLKENRCTIDLRATIGYVGIRNAGRKKPHGKHERASKKTDS